MTSRERVLSVLKKEEVDRFPRDLWALPYINVFKKEEKEELLRLFPSDLGYAPVICGESRYINKNENENSTRWTDDFGCVFEVGEPGVVGEVKDPILKTLEDIEKYEIPYEVIDNADFSQTEEAYNNSDEFVRCAMNVRPFEQMQFLRGTEELFMDMALGERTFDILSEKIHDFNVKATEEVCKNAFADAYSFMDDWGSQKALLISPELWREKFKPMYKAYCDIAHKYNKYVFFHSDGFIEDIYPDLIEIGVDAVNSQLFCMDSDKLINEYGNDIVFWGEIDRQYVLPFGTKVDVKNAVDKIAKKSIEKHGYKTGIIAQSEWGKDVSFETMKLLFEQFNRY